MSSNVTLNYVVNIQRVDASNAIRNQLDTTASISLPNNIIGDTTLALVDNQLDYHVCLIQPAMDLVFVQTDTEITVKYNTTTDTPFVLRPGGCMLVDALNLSGIYLSNTSGSIATVRILQARRQSI